MTRLPALASIPKLVKVLPATGHGQIQDGNLEPSALYSHHPIDLLISPNPQIDIVWSGLGSPFSCSFDFKRLDLMSTSSPAMFHSKVGPVSTRPSMVASRKLSSGQQKTSDCLSPTIQLITDEQTFEFPTPTRIVKAPNQPFPSSGLQVIIPPTGQHSVLHPSPTPDTLVQAQRRSLTAPTRSTSTREPKSARTHSQKQKLNQWRPFGRIFGRNRAQSSQEGNSASFLDRSRSCQDVLVEEPASMTLPRTHRYKSASERCDQSTSTTPFRRVTHRADLHQGSWPISRQDSRSNSTRCPPLSPPPPPAKDEPSPDMRLDVVIPDAGLERFSVMFGHLTLYPVRTSSLQARRYANESRHEESLMHDSSVPSRSVPEQALHISLLSNSYQHQSLSPDMVSPCSHQQPSWAYWKADDASPDMKPTRTPSLYSQASPSTPRYTLAESTPNSSPTAAISPSQEFWSLNPDDPSGDARDSAWEIITVGKRISSSDLLDRNLASSPTTLDFDFSTSPSASGNDEEPRGQDPQISIARSLSITRAGACQASNLHPVRLSCHRPKTRTLKRVDTANYIEPNISSLPSESVALLDSLALKSKYTRTTSRRQGLLLDKARESRFEEEKECRY